MGSPPNVPIALTSRRDVARLRGASDRRVTAMAIALAAAFMALAMTSILSPAARQLGQWLPLHLLLAGAASTAIAGVMPFFSAAVSGAPPAATRLRMLGIGGVAAGAALLVVGRGFWPSGSVVQGSFVAGVGGAVYLAGIAGTAAATLIPLRAALGARRIFMGAIYGVALANVAVGVTLSTAFLLGWAPVVDAWGSLKPAHAWLNLFGFVSLVIAGSLLHLLPTVAGARIRRTRASVVCFLALATGPGMVAAGYGLGSDMLAWVGAALTVTGAMALAWHAVAVMRSRATWSTDSAWHRLTTWSPVAAIGWFVVAALVAGTDVASGGAAPAGWDLAPLVVPLGIGWVGQTLVGAWSHLLPAVGPGSPERHARQRAILGRAATIRLALLNCGIGALAAGQAFALPAAAAIGLSAVLLCGLGAILLFATAALEIARE